jgi:RNA polymerase sigma factor (sigma-70 family)
VPVSSVCLFWQWIRRYRRAVTEPLKTWFAREILAHEASLVRFLNRTWPRRDEILDLRQEIYVRVYEAAARARPTAPKSFLFATARHLMTDRLRRSRIVSIEAIGDLGASNVMVDEVSPERRVDARQELKRLTWALNLLPPKCREVVWLRRVDELSQKEVAQRLGISERTVESHVLKGMRLLADAFFGARATGQSNEESIEQSESGREQQQD